MTSRFIQTALFAVALLALLGSCGGGPSAPPVTIVSIDTNPAAVTGGSVVSLSASISAPGQNPSTMTKTWTVDQGLLFDAPPDFSVVQKGASQAGGALTLASTANTVYWVAPATIGPASINLAVEGQTKTRNVTVTKSALSVAVTNGAEGAKIVTVSAASVTDLYQVAFRVNFSSAWRVGDVEQGDFLGDDAETLFIGLTNQSGFVPVSITRLGSAAGVDGGGILATITFEPSGTSSVSSLAQPFELSAPILLTSRGQSAGS